MADRYNGLFMAPGWGTAQFNVINVSYGVQTVYQQGESATERTAYFRNVTNDNFVITIEFDSWENYAAGANWFQGYCRQAADPNTSNISPMIVSVPNRDFLGAGVPEAGISFGDMVPMIVYPMTVIFTGASDYPPTGYTGTSTSRFTAPTDPGANSAFFYPTSVGTLAGPAYNAVDSGVYDAPTPAPTAPYFSSPISPWKPR